MKFHRSVKLHFNKHLTHYKQGQISAFLAEYSRAVNYFITAYYRKIPKLTKFELLTKRRIHKCVKLLNTWLSYNAIQCAFMEGYGMVASYQSNKKLNKHHNLPIHSGKTATLNYHSNKQCDAPDTKTFDFNITIQGLGNKTKISIPLHRHKQFNKWAVLGKRAKTITLTSTYILVSFEIESGSKPKITASTTNIGVDTGINNLATTSTNNFYGTELRRLIEVINRKQTGSKNQKQAIIHLKQYIDTTINILMKAEQPDLIVVEQLKGITRNLKRVGKTTRKLIKSWNYSYWLNRLQQKCEENCVVFRSVSAYNTSIKCSNCGLIDKNNRLSQEVFSCGSCGHRDHADHNAAVNILNRLLQGAYSPLLEKSG